MQSILDWVNELKWVVTVLIIAWMLVREWRKHK
jgi:hypothetical protein